MDVRQILTFSLVAWLSIASPGPAVVLAIKNSLRQGHGAVLYGALGNIFGLFFLSLGGGLLLKTNPWLLTAFKTVGAFYLFYMGVQQFTSKKTLFGSECDSRARSGLLRVCSRNRFSFQSAILSRFCFSPLCSHSS